ncbi:MAG: aminotransferase class V-fold PLP-dependent enzyme [Gemmatimonadetes bacterium]|nr:aminotransferase class V-fold PLP-dependent enzyme [Gemmatimonadota bacterium]
MPIPPRSEFARHWSLSTDVTVLNHGSFGACPTAVLAEQAAIRARLEANPTGFYFDERPRAWRSALEATAAFINADPAGIAFQINATAAVNTVLKSLTFEPGDEILVLDHAYQACRNTVEAVAARDRARVVVAAIPFPPTSPEAVIEGVMERVTDRTRLALIDAVTSPTAIRLPFERLTRDLEARGVDVVLDAAHGAGIVPLDVSALGAAYVATNCHKWLCTPKAAGVLTVRSDRRDRIRPLITSHGASIPGPPEARFRNEHDWPGTIDPTPWLCIGAAIEHLGGLLAGGWPAIIERNRDLAIRARDILAEALGTTAVVPDEMMAAMATLAIEPDPTGTARPALAPDPLMIDLLERYRTQVVVFSWPYHRARYLRVSAALYNSEAEYRHLAAALRELGVNGAAGT